MPRVSRRRPRATRSPTPSDCLRRLQARRRPGAWDVFHRERLGRRPMSDHGVLVFNNWECLRGGEDDSEAWDRQNGIVRSLHFCHTALFPVVSQDQSVQVPFSVVNGSGALDIRRVRHRTRLLTLRERWLQR